MILFRNLKVISEHAGNHRGGLSVGKSVASGCKAAEHVLSMLEGTGGRKIFTMASTK